MPIKTEAKIETCIIHPLCVAIILADLEIDKETVQPDFSRRGIGEDHKYTEGTARRDLPERMPS